MTTRTPRIACLLGAAITIPLTALAIRAQEHHNPKMRLLEKMYGNGLRHSYRPRKVKRKVAPGKVAWHSSVAAARAKALVSGKPVLIFQLLGKLDDAFC